MNWIFVIISIAGLYLNWNAFLRGKPMYPGHGTTDVHATKENHLLRIAILLVMNIVCIVAILICGGKILS